MQVHRGAEDFRLRVLTSLGEGDFTSREARKESRSLGIFKGVSKTSDSVTPPPVTAVPEPTPNNDSLPKTPVLSPEPAPGGKPEKTTKTTATYYPKLSRQDSIMASRRDSGLAASSITTREEPPVSAPRKDTRKDVGKISRETALGQVAGYESESGDEFAPGTWDSAQSVALKPYSHQVGGHSALFKFSRHAVCKPLVEKENMFYQEVEINRPDCTAPDNPTGTHY